MGIFCEMNLFKPPNEVYRPGQIVSAVIKYTIDEPIKIERISTSLKGIGWIVLKVKPGSKNEKTYRTSQNYVNIDTIIQEEKSVIPIGSYEAEVSYVIPQDIPATMKFFKYFDGYKVKCFIGYYICIKFKRPGFFSFSKYFNREINVIPEIIPTLPREPIIYGESKKLSHLFACKGSIVNIKATIQNSTLRSGDNLDVHYEVENNSCVLVKSIITVFIQSYKFKAIGHRPITHYNIVPGTHKLHTASITREETQKITININVPPDLYNIQNAMIVNRQYFIRIIAQLPIPHRHVILDIPVEIGVCDINADEDTFEQINEDIRYDDPPPSYWEIVGEEKQDPEYGSDNFDEELDNEKCEKYFLSGV